MALQSQTNSPALATPAALQLPYIRSGVERIPTTLTQALQQVKAPEGLLNVTLTDSGYTLSVYDRTQVGATSNGLYTLNLDAIPFVTWTIVTNGSQDVLQLTENRDGRERLYSYAHSGGSSTETWILEPGREPHHQSKRIGHQRLHQVLRAP